MNFLKNILKRTTAFYRVSLLVNTVVVLIGNYVVGQITKKLINNVQIKQFESFFQYVVFGGGVLILCAFIGYFTQRFLYSQADLIGKRLYIDIMETILDFPYNKIKRYNTSDLESRISYDVKCAIRIYRLDLCYIAELLVVGIGDFVFIFLINWKIGLLAMSFGILSYLVNILFLNPIKKIAKNLSQKQGDMLGVLLETIQGSKVIRTFKLCGWINSKYQVQNQHIKNIGEKQNSIETKMCFLQIFMSNMNTFLFLAFCLLFLQNGDILFGDVMAAFYYSLAVISLFTDLGNSFANLNKSYVSLERIDNISNIDIEIESSLTQRTEIVDRTAPVVLFKNVCFSYDTSTEVLKDLSFEVTEGDFLLIRGKSGAGKSTIFKLLLNFYDNWSGRICLLGESVRNLSLEDVSSKISYIPQSPFLFDGSIFENIAIIKPDSTMEDVISAAQKANFDRFVNSLPEGYQTSIGEGGASLSGGQRQRLALTRAFLKNAPVWLLDEPFSALDSMNIDEICNIISQDTSKTILLISHGPYDRTLQDKLGKRLHVLEL